MKLFGSVLHECNYQELFSSMSTDSLTYRNALSSLASGVSVVSGVYKGEKIGITVSSFTALSLKPPLILFCLDNASRNRGAFAWGKRFAINLLAEDQRSIAQHFAAAGRKGWSPIAHQENGHGLPLVEGCMAQLAARVTSRHKAGDHTIIIGKVEAITVNAKHPRPLLYFRRHYHGLGENAD